MSESFVLVVAAVALLAAAVARFRRLSLLRALRGPLAFLGVAALVQWGVGFAGLDPRYQEWAAGAVLLAFGLVAARLVLLVVFEFLLAQRVGITVPRLARDVAALLLYLLVAAAVLRNAYGMDVGALLATSAVLTVIIGLALQETFGTLLAGLALAWEQRLVAGAWLEVGGVVGQVEELGWRTLTLRTRLGDRLLLPNSQVARERVRLLGSGESLVAVPFRIGVSYAASPAAVKQVLRAVLADLPGASPERAGQVFTREFADSAVVYECRVWTREPWLEADLADALHTRAHAALARAGMEIPFPQRTLHLAVPAERPSEASRCRDALGRCDIFSGLPPDALDTLAGGSRWLLFAPGESLVRQGEKSRALYVIASGHARVERAGEVIGRVDPFDVVGEIAFLLDEPRTATVRAGEVLSVVEVDSAALRGLLAEHQDRAEELARRVASRRQALSERSTAASGARTEKRFVSVLLERLHRFVAGQVSV